MSSIGVNFFEKQDKKSCQIIKKYKINFNLLTNLYACAIILSTVDKMTLTECKNVGTRF